MTTRRSTGKMHVARALWYAKPGVVELRTATLRPPLPDEARVRTLFSGVSRGTERLILNGRVPESEWPRMRAPLQEGAFPFPVKYGYCATGIVEDGPEPLIGQTVFCLHPHQDVFIAPANMLVPVPDDVPPRRATLAANMETALNAHWDAGTGPADRIVVVGAGVVGLLVAAIAARLPGTEVTVVDVAEARRGIAESLGARFALPGKAPGDADVVFHTSATAAGLNTAIGCAGMEATVVELSWYGEKEVPAVLGGAFHSRRLRLVSSQVGQVSASRRPRWTYRRRMEAALQLLARACELDALVAEEISFLDATRELPNVLADDAAGLAPVIAYATR
ncbi:MAG: zinc-binding alcohol dehydrogenase [Hyphomicrobiaceae bacterium]|nr:zinc-binding alcohol dehydrogenase [Hyphomicrobiaceae bacterium]